MKHFVSAILIAGSILSLTSCNKEGIGEPEARPYTIPDTYSFENVDYADASARVKMLDNINKYMGTTQANANQVVLDKTKLSNMWVNTGSAFDTTWLNSTSVNLAEITSDASVFKGYLDALADLSAETLAPAADGTPGFITRGSGKILVDGNGLEYVQAVQKGVMGAALFKEGMRHLDLVPGSDNLNVTPGKGTAMSHNFDMAFGYFSIPENYDTTKAFADANRWKLLFWGNYIRERGLYINAHDILWKAFRTGRAAIQARDHGTVQQQVNIIKEYWEKLAASAAWAYVTAPQSQAGNVASQLHGLSEGFGFIASLKYRPSTSKLTAEKYNRLVEILGPTTNLYDLINDPDFTQLKEAKEILKTAYGQLQPD